MKKIISILSLSLIFSFTSLYAEVDGYKDLKFGMNNSKVLDILIDVCKNAKNVTGGIVGDECYKLMGKKRHLTAIIEKTGLVEIIVAVQANMFFPVPEPEWKSLSKGVHKKYKFYNEGILGNFQIRAYEEGQILTLKDIVEKSKATLVYLEKKRGEKTLVDLGLKKSDDSEF